MNKRAKLSFAAVRRPVLTSAARPKTEKGYAIARAGMTGSFFQRVFKLQEIQ